MVAVEAVQAVEAVEEVGNALVVAGQRIAKGVHKASSMMASMGSG